MSAWLARLPRDLNAKQVGDVLRVARIVKVDVDSVLRLARRHLDSSDVRFQLHRLLGEMPSDQRDSRTVRSLLGSSLAQTLGGKKAALDTYMAAEQLQIAATAAEGSDSAAWLTMVAHRARELAEEVSSNRLRLILPLNELRVDAARRPLELIASGLLQVAAASARAGLPIEDRLARLRLVPEPLRPASSHNTCSTTFRRPPHMAVTSLPARLQRNEWPSPEELALARRLFADDAPSLGDAIAASLGEAPTTAAVINEPLPESAIRAHRWLVAVPEAAAPDWHRVGAAITEQVGAASEDGVMMRVSEARFSGASSPVSLHDLLALAPLDAAARVAAWRREPESSFMGPSAEGLARTLRETIDADPARWIAEDPVELARALQHPVYITVLLQALGERAADNGVRAERIVELTSNCQMLWMTWREDAQAATFSSVI